jgi:hypothetical protein
MMPPSKMPTTFGSQYSRTTNQLHIRKILDAKYEAADLHEVASAQKHLSKDKQQQLKALLTQYQDLINGTLGQWKGNLYEIQLKPGAQPYHAKAFPVPRVHLETLKNEVKHLCKIGVLKKVNCSEWAAPMFLVPKPDQMVAF